MDSRQRRRVAENESRFRTANEKIVKAIDEFDDPSSDRCEIMCECALRECDEMIAMTRSAYAHVRSHPRWFAVLPDHVLEAAEKIVERMDGYWVIEKVEEGADVAEALAPDHEPGPGS